MESKFPPRHPLMKLVKDHGDFIVMKWNDDEEKPRRMTSAQVGVVLVVVIGVVLCLVLIFA